jgi:hypothetical protein
MRRGLDAPAAAAVEANDLRSSASASIGGGETIQASSLSGAGMPPGENVGLQAERPRQRTMRNIIVAASDAPPTDPWHGDDLRARTSAGLDFGGWPGMLDGIIPANKKELADGTASAGKKPSLDHGLPVGARRPFASLSSKESVSHGCLSRDQIPRAAGRNRGQSRLCRKPRRHDSPPSPQSCARARLRARCGPDDAGPDAAADERLTAITQRPKGSDVRKRPSSHASSRKRRPRGPR